LILFDIALRVKGVFEVRLINRELALIDTAIVPVGLILVEPIRIVVAATSSWLSLLLLRWEWLTLEVRLL